MKDGNIKVGIGFATGRKQFQRILRSYVYNWKESGLIDDHRVSLDLFVAYDLKYKNTKRSDYTQMSADIARLIDGKYFIGIGEVEKIKSELADQGVASPEELSLLFGSGYAAQRNIILYYALKNNIDYLLFLDDDEYPMAATRNRDTVIWSGQHVLKTHLDNIRNADITHGYHCGYISPIPHLDFNEHLQENDFRIFIEALSNDIVNWENIRKIMKNGGVSYADTDILQAPSVSDVPEINKAKFISGSNLCLNLTDPERIFPFYNPPGARGEDTFLSTCLSERKVLRIPCYAFHNGFSIYNYLLSGVLPASLKPITANSAAIVNRFYNACIGWVRYKPLLVYITRREEYRDIIDDMKRKLVLSLPKMSAYFNRKDFKRVMTELNRYDKNVEIHYAQFMKNQEIWKKLIAALKKRG